MKIAIHHRQGSFSDRWIEYCETNNIEYKIVNAFDNNIIKKGQLVLYPAFGAGLTWGAALIRV